MALARHPLLLAIPVCVALVAAPTPKGVVFEGLDRSVVPGDDFYRFANGAWLTDAAILEDRGSWGLAEKLTNLSARRIGLIIDATTKAQASTEARKIGDYYTSFMDEAAIEARGTQPLQPFLDRIGAVADRRSLSGVFGAAQAAGGSLLGLRVGPDPDLPSRYAPFLEQGGLGLPDRSYYLDEGQVMRTLRAKYLVCIATFLDLVQKEDAEVRAARVLALETRIAQVHWDRNDARDEQKGDNHWTRKEFEAKAPGLDWAAYFTAAGLNRQEAFVVSQPSAVTGIAALVGSEPLETWKDWLVFHTILQRTDCLPRAFVKASYLFYGKALQGLTHLQPRWARGMAMTDATLGEAVGKLYVKQYFPPSEKARARAMVNNILVAFARRIDALDWMTPETKARAQAKLAALKVGVGYPEAWRDYSELEVVPGDAFGNGERARGCVYQHNLKKLGQPVDRGEWGMTPQTVNAENMGPLNAFIIPAAFLQPPFFDPRHTAAQDYGAMGATIGHEISHSFDDHGARYDAEGRLHNWWSPSDADYFKASGAALVRQYDGYRPFPDLPVNGTLTLGENIADLAGLAAAHDAYRLSLRGRPAPKVQGFTGDQQFFLSWAQSWREYRSEPAQRYLLQTDPHSPNEYRADTVRNLDAWYAAFGVKPGQKQYLAPKDRVKVW